MSAICIILLTYAILDAQFALTPFGENLMHAQIEMAIFAGTGMWIVFWVLVTITFGRIYCSTVCPMGTVQDIAAHCGHSIGKKHKPYVYSKPIDGLRFPIPLIVAIFAFAGLRIVAELTDPATIYGKIVLAVARPASIGIGSIAAAWIILIIVSALAYKKGRILCNTVCPLGGLLALLSRNPVYRIDINTDKCIHCGKCEDECKSECINLQDCVVDNSRCVMCLNCTAICPNEAITVSKGRFRLSTPLMEKVDATQASIKELTPTTKPTQSNETISRTDAAHP